MTPASFHPKKCQKVGGGEADAVAMGPDSAAGQAGQGQGQLPQQMTDGCDTECGAGADVSGHAEGLIAIGIPAMFTMGTVSAGRTARQSERSRVKKTAAPPARQLPSKKTDTEVGSASVCLLCPDMHW